MDNGVKIFFIDTHAHLDDTRFNADKPDVLARAKEAGLKNIISVGCWSKQSGFDGLVKVLSAHDYIYGAVGIHPHEAKDVTGNAPYELMKKLCLGGGPVKQGRIVAIGEAGLDYHYDKSPRDKQKEAFIRQIRLARELNLPLIVHTREAEKDTIDILTQEGVPSAGLVFHCFSGTADLAEQALKMGAYLSYTGVITYPNAKELQSVVKSTPIEKMFIETDCPYLAPVPHRGKRNEPSYVVETAKAIAKLKGLTLDDVARVTTLNAVEFFGLKEKTASEEIKIAYVIRNSLYLNITNRCTNYCTFCAKFKSYTVKGHYLKLNEEPNESQLLRAIGPDPLKYDEIVFCGFGEPLIRLDLVKSIGLRLKKMGCKIRIDTDGLANLVHGRNVLSELSFVDVISVSLNAQDPATYQQLVKTPFGDNAYPAILYFLREAKKHITKVVASVVAVPGLDIEACRKVAEDDIGVAFRVREYDNVG